MRTPMQKDIIGLDNNISVTVPAKNVTALYIFLKTTECAIRWLIEYFVMYLHALPLPVDRFSMGRKTSNGTIMMSNKAVKSM